MPASRITAKWMRRVLCAAMMGALLGLTSPAAARGQEAARSIARLDVAVGSSLYPVSIITPKGYATSERWPVILLLHGAGNRGTDGVRPVQRFAPLFDENYPAIVVLPQLPPHLSWQGRGTDVALAALDSALTRFSGDTSRVYLVGVSMGGNGVWSVAWRAQSRFAALVAMCGFAVARRGTSGTEYPPIAPDNTYASVAAAFRTIPVWIFHGDADPQVPVEESRRLAAALQSVQAPARYTELPGLGHDIAANVLSRRDLVEWLFMQRRTSPR